MWWITEHICLENFSNQFLYITKWTSWLKRMSLKKSGVSQKIIYLPPVQTSSTRRSRNKGRCRTYHWIRYFYNPILFYTSHQGIGLLWANCLTRRLLHKIYLNAAVVETSGKSLNRARLPYLTSTFYYERFPIRIVFPIL